MASGMTNEVRIRLGLNPHDNRFELNGEVLDDVVSFHLDADGKSVPIVHLAIIANVLIDGEYEERVVSSTRAPEITLALTGPNLSADQVRGLIKQINDAMDDGAPRLR